MRGRPRTSRLLRRRFERTAPVERVVLHVGMHKTGSTAIQASLDRSYEALLARGVLYPRAGRRGLGHSRLANELRYTEGPVAELPGHRAVLAETRELRPATLLVSAEALSAHVGPRQVEWSRHLRDALQPRRAELIAYVRPQWDAVESRYAQHVKGGAVWAPFERWLEQAAASGELDHLAKLDRWSRSSFRLEVRPYGRDVLLGGNSVTDFWDALGLGTPPAPPVSGVASQRRMGARTTEMVRLVRASMAGHRLDGLLPPVPDHPRPDQRAMQWIIDGTRRRIEAALPDDRPFAPLTEEMATEVAARFAASNERLVDRYLGGRHLELFQRPVGARQVSRWTIDEATEEERLVLADALAHAMGRLRAARSVGSEGSGRRSSPLVTARRLRQVLSAQPASSRTS